MKLVQENAKQIVCIIPKGKAAALEQALIEDHDIHETNFHHARGVGRFPRMFARGIGEQREKDIFEVTVSSDIADEIFEYIFFKAEMDQPHGGIIYMIEAPRASIMQLTDLPEEVSL
ncbi:MAG: hypothetical protein CMQ21_03850 [Gammaproteobacteria bacterium]|jgi:nitrogen regulatory protein PII|nr:hypothetical protein [Gammaproteobacteria bacterium]